MSCAIVALSVSVVLQHRARDPPRICATWLVSPFFERKIIFLAVLMSSLHKHQSILSRLLVDATWTLISIAVEIRILPNIVPFLQCFFLRFEPGGKWFGFSPESWSFFQNACGLYSFPYEAQGEASVPKSRGAVKHCSHVCHSDHSDPESVIFKKVWKGRVVLRWYPNKLFTQSLVMPLVGVNFHQYQKTTMLWFDIEALGPRRIGILLSWRLEKGTLSVISPGFRSLSGISQNVQPLFPADSLPFFDTCTYDFYHLHSKLFRRYRWYDIVLWIVCGRRN